MNFQEFCNHVKTNILFHMPPEYAGAEVFVEPTMKNNSVVWQGLVVQKEGNQIVPKVYLESFFEKYKAGKTLEDTMMDLAESYQEHSHVEMNFDVSDMTSFEKVKERITTKVVAAKQNRELALERPHTRIDDLAVFYQVDMQDYVGEEASMPITNNLMEKWNISVSDLHPLAVENMERLHPSSLADMGGIIFGETKNFFIENEYEPSDPWLVLTNVSLTNGAAAIANPEVMKRVSEIVQDDFFILPSSIHELLIFPKGAVAEMGMTPKELGKMVREVNETQVDREERLSDHIYSYDREQRCVESCRESMKKSKDLER